MYVHKHQLRSTDGRRFLQQRRPYKKNPIEIQTTLYPARMNALKIEITSTYNLVYVYVENTTLYNYVIHADLTVCLCVYVFVFVCM